MDLSTFKGNFKNKLNLINDKIEHYTSFETIKKLHKFNKKVAAILEIHNNGALIHTPVSVLKSFDFRQACKEKADSIVGFFGKLCNKNQPSKIKSPTQVSRSSILFFAPLIRSKI